MSTDTPRTDAQGYGDGMHPYVPTEFARQLERELASARASEIAMFCDLGELRLELEQERQDRKQADLDTIRALGERNDARRLLARLDELVTTDHESKESFIARVKATLDPNNLEGPGPTTDERRENARAIQALTVPERIALLIGKNQTDDDQL